MLTLELKEHYKKLFKQSIMNKADQIDPNAEYTWEALAVGFYIGKLLSVEDAKDLALETDL